MPYTCTCRIATGEFIVDVYVLVVRGNSPREGWQFDSPHSPVLPCSCNVIGTLATLDVLSSEHPGQLPPQTLPERVTSTRIAGTRFSANVVPVPQRSPAAPMDTAREGGPLGGPGSLQQLGCLRMYLRTYVRMCARTY